MKNQSRIQIIFPLLIFVLINTDSSSSKKLKAKVRMIQGRSIGGSKNVEIETNGKIKKLKLSPLNNNIWDENAQALSVSHKNGKKVVERKNIDKDINVYEDGKGSVLTVKSRNLNGILNSNYAIKPEKGEHYIEKHKFKAEFPNDNILFPDKIPKPKKMKGRKINLKKSKIISVEPIITSRKKSKKDFTVEIVVIVDSILAELIGNDSEIYEYLAIFWNGVNARFKTITSPEITLKLVGAIIMRDAESEPFIQRKDKGSFNSSAALDSLGLWLYSRLATLPSHDIIYLQTGGDMLDEDGSDRVSGLAYTTGACKLYRDYISHKTSVAVAMGEDINAYFNGIFTAAHEIGHSLGSRHDDKTTQRTECIPDQGYLMSYNPGKLNYLYFSKCSIENMLSYMTSSDAECLVVETAKPKEIGTFNTTKLPGDILSLKEQCKYLTGESNAEVSSKVKNEDELCYNLQCEYIQGNSKYTITAMKGSAEGSICPSGKRCSNGACV